jgi:hypothetical protein
MRNTEQIISTETFYLTAAALIGIAVLDVATNKPIDPEGQFSVMIVNKDWTFLKQGDKEYRLATESLSQEIKDSLIKQRPDLESFLKDGPINIINKN